MGKYDRVVDIQKTPRTRNAWRLIEKELEKRAASLHRTVSYLAAQDAYDSLMEGIPAGNEYKELRDSLEVAEVGVGKGNQGAYAVHAPVKSRKVRKIDVPKTIVYVRAKKRLTRPDPAVQLLEDTGPWTADTIPFWPNKKEAVVVQRKVTKKEADKVAEAQKPKIPKILQQLSEMGRRVKKKKKGEPGHVGRNQKKAVPDVAMQALELEFGGQGKRATPVFRKMIRSVRGGMRTMAKRHRIITQTMTDPNSGRWKNFPPRKTKISTGKASSFKGFQKRLR